MTDADLARWEADAMETMGHGHHRARLFQLIAEVRRLRAELHLLHGMTNERGRALFPAEMTVTPITTTTQTPVGTFTVTGAIITST